MMHREKKVFLDKALLDQDHLIIEKLRIEALILLFQCLEQIHGLERESEQRRDRLRDRLRKKDVREIWLRGNKIWPALTIPFCQSENSRLAWS